MAPAALPPLDQLDPVDAWKPWAPSDKDPFNAKWAGHLYRRAAFGATLAELRAAEKHGVGPTIDLLMKGEPKTKDQEAADSADWLAFLNKNVIDAGKQDKPDFFGRYDPYKSRAGWLYNMLYGRHPLREKLTLFWHNHFATSVAKIKDPKLMARQNILLRTHALGKFGPFLLEMSKDAAMIAWLDNNSNDKAHPNENYAREVMELFSLGVGNYTEKDVREAARAFTGWHTDGDDNWYLDARYHDDGDKVLLGTKGKLGGEDVLAILLKEKTCAQFIVRKLYRYLVSENVEPSNTFTEPLCDQFRKSDYDIAGLVRTMLASRHFFSGYAFRQRIKSPVELVVGAVHETVEGYIQPQLLVRRIDAMGQTLFAPPNVKGWPGGQSWLNTSTVLARQNFAQALAMGMIWRENPPVMANPFQQEIEEPPLPRGAKKPVRPEEPPPAKEQDPVRVVKAEKATTPEEVVRVLLEVYLPGGVSDSARKRLVAFVADGKPQDAALERRARETVHAILSMSEYQMA